MRCQRKPSRTVRIPWPASWRSPARHGRRARSRRGRRADVRRGSGASSTRSRPGSSYGTADRVDGAMSGAGSAHAGRPRVSGAVPPDWRGSRSSESASRSRARSAGAVDAGARGCSRRPLRVRASPAGAPPCHATPRVAVSDRRARTREPRARSRRMTSPAARRVGGGRRDRAKKQPFPAPLQRVFRSLSYGSRS
jgi:hypothetical protein